MSAEVIGAVLAGGRGRRIGGDKPLRDGGVTTQPEFSFWFKDVGWAVENYGTDPDVVVENRPQDTAAGRDPQLARGIELALAALKKAPAALPRFGPRPSLAAPKLPPLRPPGYGGQARRR